MKNKKLLHLLMVLANLIPTHQEYKVNSEVFKICIHFNHFISVHLICCFIAYSWICHLCMIYSHQKLVMFRNIEVSQSTSLIEYSFWYSWMFNGRPPAIYCWIVDSWKKEVTFSWFTRSGSMRQSKFDLSNGHSLETSLLYTWSVAWLGSNITQNFPKPENPWCSHHTKAKAKLNAVNKCVLNCPYNILLMYQNKEKGWKIWEKLQ